MSQAITQEHGRYFSAYLGDNVLVLQGFPADYFHYSVFSVPFASLYTYSSTAHDMGNCKGHEEFMQHYAFLARELFRVMKPGRNVSIHSMDLPTSKVRDGYIGLVDFPGMLIRSMQDAGFIWHSKVTIWKDPVTAMQRTKALGLLHKQVKKDSCMSRMGIPDYVHTFRKPEVNAEPVAHNPGEFVKGTMASRQEEYPVEYWQRIASPVWDDIDMSDTLQYRNAKDEEDEKHMCPLQRGVYKRCLELWSNPGDIVLEPFGGIGSGGWVAMGGETREGRLSAPRRTVYIELKPSYYRIGIENLRAAEPGALGEQTSLLNMVTAADVVDAMADAQDDDIDSDDTTCASSDMGDEF